MNFIWEISFIFLLYVILSAFHLQHLAGKKVTLKKDTCASNFEQSVEDPNNKTTSWIPNPDRGKSDCSICNPQDAKESWLVTKPIPVNGQKSIHVDVTMFRSGCKSCQNQDIRVYISHQMVSADWKIAFMFLKTLKPLTTLKNEKDLTEKIHNFAFEPKSDTFSILFVSAGSCTQIKDIDVYSYVCDNNTSSGVNLPETIAPANGFQRVNVSCSASTLNLGNDEAYGLCSSKGEWDIISPCMCKEGYTLRIGAEGCMGKLKLFEFRNMVE